MFDKLNALQEKIISRKTNPEKLIVQQIALLMMELNISYKDMMEMPIPAFMQLGKALADIKKMEAKAYKKGSRRKR